MNNDRARMYELEFPTPNVSAGDHSGPTLIVAMDGYADAGNAVAGSAEHLLDALEHRPVASFNSDELIDYRSRRPSMVIDGSTVQPVQELHLGIDAVKDTKGKPFLLLSGPEPDLRWQAFTDAVVELIERLGVRKTICLYGAPMTVPHTRPLVVSAHGNDQRLVAQQYRLDTHITVPGSAALQLEAALHTRGRSVAGYTAHVPHYLASNSYPQASLSLLESVALAAELDLPLKTLLEDAKKTTGMIEEQVAGSPEIQQVVHALEGQYDEELERYREAHPHAVLPGEGGMPNGEQLGEEFERFLAQLGQADQQSPPDDASDESSP